MAHTTRTMKAKMLLLLAALALLLTGCYQNPGTLDFVHTRYQAPKPAYLYPNVSPCAQPTQAQ
jgi:uncharacterized lipoprotein YajG